MQMKCLKIGSGWKALKTMGSTEHKETLKAWLLMSDELSGTSFANSQADYENVLRVCCRYGWGVPASVGVIQEAASGGVPSALSKCATILMAMLSIVVLAGCRYEAVDANVDVVDYIIRGDARGAAKCCSLPLDLNRVSPLISIDNEKDFIRLFPIVFDRATRLEIAEKKKGAENNGWDFHNWQGESFVGGLLWRGYYGDNHKLFRINIFSESLARRLRRTMCGLLRSRRRMRTAARWGHRALPSYSMRLLVA